MILEPAPRERERWHAIWWAAQGWAALVVANGLDPHPIGRWVPAFGEGGPAVLIFEQTGGPPRHWSSAAGGTERRRYRRRSAASCTGLAHRREGVRRPCRAVLQSKAESLL